MGRLGRWLGIDRPRVADPPAGPTPDLDAAFTALYLENTAIYGRFDETLYTTYKVIEYLVRNGIAGDVVECGVYRGRHCALAACTLASLGDCARRITLCDTFEGMTRPTAEDYKLDPRRRQPDAGHTLAYWESQREGEINAWCLGTLDEVRGVMAATKYPSHLIEYLRGDVATTLAERPPAPIAFLRLDTDWYESTRAELVHLYDQVVRGGVVVMDDYGAWQGARKAADEFFAERGIHPLLFRTSAKERAFLR